MMAAAPLALRPQGALADEPIRLAASGSESFVQGYYVIDGGFAAKEGLNVTCTTFGNAAQGIQGIVGGSLDAAVADMTQIANAVAHGLDLAFFAGSSVYRSDAPVTELCVAKNSPLRTPKDLEGQTVSVNGLRTLAEISTRETVRLAGGDPAKVTFVEIPPAAAIPALLRGTVGAAIVSEPFISSSADIRRFAKPYDAVAKSFYICAWVAKTDWLKGNAPTARKLTSAIYESAKWTNGDHAASEPVLIKDLKLDPDKVHAATRATFATSLDPKLMQPVLDIAVKYGLLEHPVDATSLIFKS